jgi:hypothetical protein
MYTLYTFLLVVMLIAITDGFDPFYKIIEYVKLELKYAIIRARLNLINVQVRYIRHKTKQLRKH